jgi:ATP-dependent Clp protease, protease subunit
MIRIAGEINEESFAEFVSSTSKSTRVNILLISEGGCSHSAMAYYDYIIAMRNKGCHFSVTATGLVASAATLILAACQDRYMTENAWVMVHEDSLSGLDDKKVWELEKEIKHSRRLEDQWVKLMYEATGISIDTWKELHKNETYLNAKECVALGLIKEIV